MSASHAEIQAAKRLVRDFHQALDAAPLHSLVGVFEQFASPDVRWRGVHPFDEQIGAANIVGAFWAPMRRSFAPLQRRRDIFLAGSNIAHRPAVDADVDSGAAGDEEGVWVCEMGHLVGLFDQPWLGIPPTGRMAFNRYAEFSHVVENVIVEQSLHVDVISVMRLAGHDPLPPQYGADIVQPGPMNHDGLLDTEQPSEAGDVTMALVNDMIELLTAMNDRADDECTPEELAQHWHDDMIWYGPAGIGTTYTIRRYQRQHQRPFRKNLHAKRFNGHVARFAEGEFACFFGWPNLSNRASGGFLGLPGNEIDADMRVIDIYRRDGDKLAENWVFMDLPHYLRMQGLDVLGRMRDQLFIPSETNNQEQPIER